MPEFSQLAILSHSNYDRAVVPFYPWDMADFWAGTGRAIQSSGRLQTWLLSIFDKVFPSSGF